MAAGLPPSTPGIPWGAVRLVRDGGRPVRAAAKDLGVSA